jgi:hypothetical protein
LGLALEVDELTTRRATLSLHYNLGSCDETKHYSDYHGCNETQDKWAGAAPHQKSADDKCGN